MEFLTEFSKRFHFLCKIFIVNQSTIYCDALKCQKRDVVSREKRAENALKSRDFKVAFLEKSDYNKSRTANFHRDF